MQPGLSRHRQLFTKAGVAQLRGTRMSAVMQYQREQWLQALEP
jgi:hypothetical protein